MNGTQTIECVKRDLFNAILYVKYEALGVTGACGKDIDHGSY